MKITEDVRQYAAEHGYGVEETAAKGMEEMSELYKNLGNKLYLKDEEFENTVNPLEDLSA